MMRIYKYAGIYSVHIYYNPAKQKLCESVVGILAIIGAIYISGGKIYD